MTSVNDELREYAKKVAAGRASVSDESRIHQIGAALNRGVEPPEAAAPVLPVPAPEPVRPPIVKDGKPAKPAPKKKGK